MIFPCRQKRKNARTPYGLGAATAQGDQQGPVIKVPGTKKKVVNGNSQWLIVVNSGWSLAMIHRE